MLATPNQAGKLFSASSTHPPRQKHLFVVRFVRNGSTQERGLTFVVKSMDRPSVEISTETLNQYNRKRLIHTGVKYNPVNVTFYDTADGEALNMWTRYARYYIADYRQGITGYTDDLLNDEITDPAAIGYGFKIPKLTEGLLDRGAGTQNYFSHVEVYQVWGGEYISYSLVNPRITNFTPDELSYESSDLLSISMSLQFEAIDHTNDGLAQKVTDNEVLSSIFGGEFAGNTLAVDGPVRTTNFIGIPDEVSKPSDVYSFPNDLPVDISRNTIASEGGVLSRFGSFDFGSGAAATETSTSLAIGGLLEDIGLSQNAARAASVVGEAILSIPGMATGINRAANAAGDTGYDHVSKVDGISLSDRAIYEFNRLANGTFLMGTKSSD